MMRPPTSMYAVDIANRARDGSRRERVAAHCEVAACTMLGRSPSPFDFERFERLTGDDVVIMRDHAAVGCRLVSEDERVAHLASHVRAHHERIDGRATPTASAGRRSRSRVDRLFGHVRCFNCGRPYQPRFRYRAPDDHDGYTGPAMGSRNCRHLFKMIEPRGQVPRVVPASAAVKQRR